MIKVSARFCSLLGATSLVLLAASTAQANSYSGPIDKSLWGTNVPAHIDMFMAVPDQMPEKPPIIVNIHSCGNTAGGQWSYDGFAALRDAIDSVGYIMIVPQQSRNCWDVGTDPALTHEGGSDTLAIVQMVRYVIEEYGADPTRVYVMGGSGGGMMVQALLAVYPEVFKAGHARAGVPAGCWAEGYQDGDQWSDSCAGGSVDKTPQEWGDYVRGINPDYDGPRPRVQINQGDVDTTISYNNFREAIDEWTNVLELSTEPTRTDSNFQGASATYDRQFWDDACGYTVFEAWTAKGMGHSMGYEAVHILEFFGLDQKRDRDPWDEACGDFVTPGGGGAGGAAAGGASGAAAMAGAGGDTSAPTGGTSMGGTPAAGGQAAGGTPVVGAAGMAAGGSGVVAPPGSGTSAPPGTGVVPPPVATPPDATPTPVPAGGGGTPNTGAPPASAGAPGASAMPMGSATGAPVNPVTTDAPADSEGGCTLVPSASKGSAVSLAFLALGFVLLRRRRTP